MAKDVTLPEAAQALGSTQFVYVLLRDRKLEGRKQNGRWPISTRSIAARKKQLASRPS